MNLKIDPRILISQATQPSTDRKSRDLQSLRKSSQEFETMLVREMIKAMRQTIPDGGLFEKDMASETFTEMLDLETAKAATGGKGLGIADLMYQQMAALVEKKR